MPPKQLTEEKIDPRVVQPREAETWEKKCELTVTRTEGEDGPLYYATLDAPAWGCGEARRTLKVGSVEAAIRHALDWCEAHKVRVIKTDIAS